MRHPFRCWSCANVFWRHQRYVYFRHMIWSINTGRVSRYPGHRPKSPEMVRQRDPRAGETTAAFGTETDCPAQALRCSAPVLRSLLLPFAALLSSVHRMGKLRPGVCRRWSRCCESSPFFPALRAPTAHGQGRSAAALSSDTLVHTHTHTPLCSCVHPYTVIYQLCNAAAPKRVQSLVPGPT